MFYKKGIDITNDKQMFEFLKGHLEYPTLNSWNRLYSIANNVKLNRLGLSGDWCTALAFLENGEYDNLGFIIHDWTREHVGYEVYFNGRSGGYLVLKDVEHNSHILPESILDNDTYEEYKEWCRENYGTVKANRPELIYFTKLVQDFDKLCDELRDYCDELSNLKFEVIEMQKTVDEFNDYYREDLDSLGFKPLCCDENGKVDINEIRELNCLVAAFMSTAKRPTISSGYALKITDEGIATYESRF